MTALWSCAVVVAGACEVAGTGFGAAGGACAGRADAGGFWADPMAVASARQKIADTIKVEVALFILRTFLGPVLALPSARPAPRNPFNVNTANLLIWWGLQKMTSAWPTHNLRWKTTPLDMLFS
jgi:hypothetical protein